MEPAALINFHPFTNLNSLKVRDIVARLRNLGRPPSPLSSRERTDVDELLAWMARRERDPEKVWAFHDQRRADETRGAAAFTWPPEYTHYSYGALEGASVLAEILHRRGHPF